MKPIKLLAVCLSVQISASSIRAELYEPIPIRSRNVETNGAIIFKDRSSRPPKVGIASLLTSPAPDTAFLGLEGHELVPDTFGAVGRGDFVLTMLNTGVGVRTRAGLSLLTNSLGGFWTSTNINFASVYDPRVVYDPFNDRWIACAVTDGVTPNASILIGVSRTSNPTNFGDAGWNLREIKADTSNEYGADQPTLGFNKDWIVVQANMSSLNTNVYRSHFWVFNKTNLYAGGLSYTLLFHTDPSTNWVLSWAEVPATTYDNSLSTLYLVQNANGNFEGSGRLRLFSITGALGSEVLTVNTNYIVATGKPWADLLNPYDSWRCGFLPQTNGRPLGTVPDARMSSVVYRNGSLWCAHTIFLPTNNPTRSAIQWWRIKPDTNELLERGRIDDSGGVSYCFPSIAVNRFNDLLIGYSSFSSNQYPSASYSFRAFDDPLDGNELRKTRIYQPGLTNFGVSDVCRWGDYSATVVDPINDTDLWTIQEYSLTNGLNFEGVYVSFWATYWAQLKMTVPSNDNFNTAFLMSGAQGTTNGTITRATLETGEQSHAVDTYTPSVWYNWTPPTNGNVAIKVIGASDTMIAVYTGNSLGNLALLTNHHGGAAGSQTVFNASSNTTYRVAVAGWNGAHGDFVLTWTVPSIPFFTLQPRGWDVYKGTNVTFTAQAIGAPDPDYQWRFNGVNIAGATTSSYTKMNVQTNDTGDFTVIATNLSGSTSSQTAHLQVYSTEQALITAASFNSASNFSRFLVSGITGGTYIVEASTNLINWNPIKTNITTFTNLDYDVTNFPYRFYRARYGP